MGGSKKKKWPYRGQGGILGVVLMFLALLGPRHRSVKWHLLSVIYFYDTVIFKNDMKMTWKCHKKHVFFDKWHVINENDATINDIGRPMPVIHPLSKLGCHLGPRLHPHCGRRPHNFSAIPPSAIPFQKWTPLALALLLLTFINTYIHTSIYISRYKATTTTSKQASKTTLFFE